MRLIKSLLGHSKLLLGLALGWTATVAYFCLVSSGGLPSIAIGFDKLGHLVFHFGIAFSWFCFFYSRQSDRGFNKAVFTAFFLSLFYGILIEFLQKWLTTTRQADIKDVFANTVGALLAVALVYLLKRFKKL